MSCFFQVLMGGGRAKFFPNTDKDQQNLKGQRLDGRNLIKEWLLLNRTHGARSAYITDRSQLMSVNTSQTDYLLGKYHMAILSLKLFNIS